MGGGALPPVPPASVFPEPRTVPDAFWTFLLSYPTQTIMDEQAEGSFTEHPAKPSTCPVFVHSDIMHAASPQISIIALPHSQLFWG